MSIEENKALIRKIFEEVERKGEFPIELCTPNFQVYQPGIPAMDLNGHNKHLKDIRKGFPDIKQKVEIIIAEDDMVAVRFVSQGTHTHEFGIPIPPKGKKISILNHCFGRIENGKLAEWWISPDTIGMMRQLGLISPENIPSPDKIE